MTQVKQRRSIRGSDSSPPLSETDSIEAINRRKDEKAAEPPPSQTQVNDSPPPPEKDSTSKPDPFSDLDSNRVVMTEDEFQILLEQKGRQEADRVRSQSTQELEQLKDELEALKQSVVGEQEKNKELKIKYDNVRVNQSRLARIQARMGLVGGGGDTTISPVVKVDGRNYLNDRDAVLEYNQIIEQSPRFDCYNPDTGEILPQRDFREADLFVLENRDSVRRGMESKFKEAGFLRGNISIPGKGKDEITVAGTIPTDFLDYLSTEGRLTQVEAFSLWQFVNTKLELDKGVGQTILFARTLFGDAPDESDAYTLDPAVPLVKEYQALRSSSVPIEIKSHGLGRDLRARPYAVAEILTANSMADLIASINRNLGRSYHHYEEVMARELLFSTTRTLYSSGGYTVETEAEVQAGDGGTFTYEFLLDLATRMADADIPPFDDGCWVVLLNTRQISQLDRSLSVQKRFLDRAGAEEVTNLLKVSTGNAYIDRVSGYKGTIGGFHVFQSNSFGRGVAPQIGVQQETLGAGVFTTRTGFAIGSNTMGRCLTMPMQIRESNDDDFGRIRKLTWLESAGWGGLDIDPLRNPPLSDSEQLRVFEFRTTDREV